MTRFKKGQDYRPRHKMITTYGITQSIAQDNDHINKIEVYGDRRLRDKILEFLKTITIEAKYD